MEVGSLIGAMAIMATLPSNIYASGDSKEDKIKAIILAFVMASAKTGIDIDILGSLGWSESPSYALGYWDRNTHNNPNAHGIMQLWGSQYAGLSDMENIEKGAEILMWKHYKAVEIINRGNGYFTVKDEKTNKVKQYDLSDEEKKDDWLLAVRLYKGAKGNSSALAKDWKYLIYLPWPYPQGVYKNSSGIMADLWNKRDTFTILIR